MCLKSKTLPGHFPHFETSNKHLSHCSPPPSSAMVTHYSLDNAISSFFESMTSATRQQCDDFALGHTGGQPSPVQIQGTFSYTVAVGATKILQFRVLDPSLDMHVMSLAKAVHPQFVASCKYHGTIGRSRPVHIYEMENLPGAAYIIARSISTIQSADAVSPAAQHCERPSEVRVYHTMMSTFQAGADHACSFFAQSWNSRRRLDLDNMATLQAEFESKCDVLTRSLPPRFTSNLHGVRQSPPSLFSETFPFVLNHGDLCEMNILIGRETGNITGIVDWAEARILPFGFALWGLENILGCMDSTGWHYYDNRRELEDRLWRAFRTGLTMRRRATCSSSEVRGWRACSGGMGL
ncbi:hypothetical protein BKA67DRAFT_533706 [Truncatella angustata]|uniref:Aminoglycoside phosphotransferase domain-containing protein n=1 Tax=Truncatella angustata TaxID=152316 RepID=A0A9P8UUE7_9PEZI|nr:uncharacterized protein BKA67DRAFT_533706 [Truncatella angustata]KAH6658559.1 hypothetical protein BKA67DRAFT_533706 [Truncatella angustata]